MRIITTVITLLLLACSAALAWQLRSEIDANHRLSQDIADLHLKLADKSKRDNLDFQKQCAEQAGKIFHQNNGAQTNQNGEYVVTYESHYNSTINRCFLLQHESDLTKSRYYTLVLYDAYENREYAELNVFIVGGERHIATCALMPPSGDQQTCQSEAEFRSFVAQYMESTPGPM